MCIFTESILDSSGAHASTITCSHVCALCSKPCPAFATAKALASHQRVVHGVRSPMRAFADAHGECPVCKSKYGTRLRLLAHLSDSRRPRCRNDLLSGQYPTLTDERIKELDAIDRVAR
eukprot:3974320-Karenia_brevis.AAC.1